ncbi:MAG: peptidase [Phycisphaerales bacterium]|nr:MAG: peptidase [Phycisphaerales bacterium]
MRHPITGAPIVSNASRVDATSRIAFTPLDTTATGNRVKARMSALTSSGPPRILCTPPTPPVAKTRTPAAAASSIVALTVVAHVPPALRNTPRLDEFPFATRSIASIAPSSSSFIPTTAPPRSTPTVAGRAPASRTIASRSRASAGAASRGTPWARRVVSSATQSGPARLVRCTLNVSVSSGGCGPAWYPRLLAARFAMGETARPSHTRLSRRSTTRMKLRRLRSLVCAAALGASPFVAHAQPFGAPPPTPIEGMAYDAPFFPGANYDARIPTPDALLGWPLGSKAATHAEIERCVQAWAEASDRATLVEYARSYEGRALYYMVITSPANHARLDAIKADTARLADPRQVSVAEADRLVDSLPAVAWMAYSIHGDEMSGADAALGVAYHLVASTDDDVRAMLDETVVIIDPLMNPDGRDRFIQQVVEHRGAMPTVDDQSVTHTGYWPRGRTNHYMFDLNRDWILGVHPETRGRIRAVDEWNPLLFVDAHEMGAQDTYLFSPSREPVNIHLPESRKRWWGVFAKDQAGAFDRFGWLYYTGEWNEEWYPGYSSSWAGFRGALGILYEQARVADWGVARPEGTILTYRETVHHQIVSSMVNLESLRANRTEMLRDYAAERRRAVSADGPYGSKVFAVVPGANAARAAAFVDLMLLQGFEVYTSDEAFTAPTARDRLGRTHESRELPAGTILIPNRQPEAHLIAAMLDFDPRFRDEFLESERRELLRFNQSRLYDTTSWNITMYHDLEAYVFEGATPRMSRRTEAVMSGDGAAARSDSGGGGAVAWVIDGADDRSVAIAGRLMERGVRVRVGNKPIMFDGREFARGSLVVAAIDNGRAPEWRAILREVCAERGVAPTPVGSGLGKGEDFPDMGGEHFPLLTRPRIAVLTRGRFSPNNVGEIWHAIDQRLGVRATLLSSDFGLADLRRYNVLVVPESWRGDALGEQRSAIRDWVRQGGTLIAFGRSAAALTRGGDDALVRTRTLEDVLDDLGPHQLQVMREWAGRTASIDADSVWSHLAPGALEFPWERVAPLPDKDERKRRDEWQRVFMPQGAFLAARTDDRHWLTFGCADALPVMYADDTILMTDGAAEAPIRFGVWEPIEPNENDADTDEHNKDTNVEKPARPLLGWAPAPEGHTLRLRMSGLLWPEAAHRIANSAYVTRERVGAGQVILFASNPVFRGAALGTERVFTNALIYGPGMGTRQPLTLP